MLGIDIVEISRIKKLMEEKENFLSKPNTGTIVRYWYPRYNGGEI